MTDDCKRPAKAWKANAIMAAVLTLGLATVWGWAGRDVVEKLLTSLVMPLGLLWLLLTSLCVTLAVRRSPLALLAGVAWLVCVVAGNGLIAARVCRSIEAEYLQIDPLDHAPLKRIVILGGAASEGPHGQLQVNGNGDRIVLGARMYHRGLTQLLVCTGAKIEGLGADELDTGVVAQRILWDLGVPQHATAAIGGQNTSAEMREIASLLRSQGDAHEPVGIITSAWHMERAMRLATAENINAVPVPAGFGSGPQTGTMPLAALIQACIPHHFALAANATLLKEKLAGLVNR